MVAHKFHKLNCSSVYVPMLYQGVLIQDGMCFLGRREGGALILEKQAHPLS